MSTHSKGWTDLTISPSSMDFKQFRINCRQAEILSVFVNSVQAQFNHCDPLSDILPDKNPFHHLEASELLAKAVVEGDKGELLIYIPESVEITRIDGLDAVEDNPGNY